ncbi:CG6891 [Drosophila busckii]|uniref:CG6891 n=1 Tax=Drosophila busckii TaxID=30019 RepID=A0A0M4EUG5_DROBS|nr:CG6891 [Drosophila busckii]
MWLHFHTNCSPTIDSRAYCLSCLVAAVCPLVAEDCDAGAWTTSLGLAQSWTNRCCHSHWHRFHARRVDLVRCQTDVHAATLANWRMPPCCAVGAQTSAHHYQRATHMAAAAVALAAAWGVIHDCVQPRIWQMDHCQRFGFEFPHFLHPCHSQYSCVPCVVAAHRLLTVANCCSCSSAACALFPLQPKCDMQA